MIYEFYLVFFEFGGRGGFLHSFDHPIEIYHLQTNSTGSYQVRDALIGKFFSPLNHCVYKIKCQGKANNDSEDAEGYFKHHIKEFSVTTL